MPGTLLEARLGSAGINRPEEAGLGTKWFSLFSGVFRHFLASALPVREPLLISLAIPRFGYLK
jgi:hypothetical protein